jgi:hypothetical protein
MSTPYIHSCNNKWLDRTKLRKYFTHISPLIIYNMTRIPLHLTDRKRTNGMSW